MTLLIGGAAGKSLPQPLNVFFDLEIGGLSKIFVNPNIPIDFMYKNGQDGSLVKFTLFDVTGGDVEPAIWNSRQTNVNKIPGGQFQFGYQGSANVQSAVYSFQLENYIPQFIGNAFCITIIGSITPLSFLGSTNQYSGTPTDIINKIAQNFNMTANIDPPLGVNFMQDTGYVDKDTTALSEVKLIKQMSEADWSFLQRVVKECIGNDGKGGYGISISTADGKQVLNITRPKQTSTSLEYTVQAPDTTVITWEPNIDFSKSIFGANGWTHNSNQVSTGDEQKMVLSQNVTKPFQTFFNNDDTTPLILPQPVPVGQPNKLIYTCSPTMGAEITGAASRARPAATGSPYNMNKELNDHLRAWLRGSTANLTILGDPTIDPWIPGASFLQTVDVTCYYPHNYNTGNITAPTPTGQQLHYTSGTYRLNSVTHTIRAGEYQTLLELERADMPTPAKASS